MSYVLSKTPAWLESPVFSFSHPGSEIVLLSGDGHQVRVPAVLLLSTSHLVRSLLSDHLPLAYSPPAISLPAVTRQVLYVVRQLCTEGRAYVDEERKGEVENVFNMLNVSCQLDGDIRGDHGKEMKVGEGAVVQPAHHDLSWQFKGADEEQVQVELTQDYNEDLEVAQHVEKEITVNVEKEALVAQNIVILEASSSNEASKPDLPEVEVSPDTFGNESDVDSIIELGLRPCTSSMPAISPQTVTTTQMSVQVSTEEFQAPIHMETITMMSNKRIGPVTTKLIEQRKDHFKKLKAFGEIKAAKIFTKSSEVLSGKIMSSRRRGASVAAGRQSQTSAALLNSEKQSGVSKPVQLEELQTNKTEKLLVSCLGSEVGAVDQGWMTIVKVDVIDGIEKAEAAHFKKLEAFREMKTGNPSTRIITRSLKVDSGKKKSRLRGAAGVGPGRQFQGPDGGQDKEHKHGQPSRRENLSRMTKSVPGYTLARSRRSRAQSQKVEVDKHVIQEVSCQLGSDWMTKGKVINGGEEAGSAKHSEIKTTINDDLAKTTRNVVLEHDIKICTDCKCKICDTAGTKEKLSEDYRESKKCTIKQTLQWMYVCQECGKGFKTKYKLEKHSSFHTKVRPYHCDQCGLKYATASGLDAHIKDKHQGVKYQCEECGRQFGKKCNLTDHINQVHRRVKLFQCQTCDLSFARKLHLTVHIDVVHENRKDFMCEHCNKSFGRADSMKVHIDRFHLDTSYPCSWPDCRYIGASKVDLKAHMKRKGVTGTGNKEGNRYWCALCKIGFENCRTKKLHVKTVHPNKLKPCTLPECTFIAYTNSALWYHNSRAHAKEKN